jgi:putative thioredoxin
MGMSPHVTDVSTADFSSAVLQRSFEVPVVVDFWAEWCGPCKVLGPTLERLATEGQGSWELAKVDVDANQQLAMQFGVKGIPTVIAFKDGQPVGQFTGALPEDQLRQFVDSLAPSELDVAAERAYLALDEGDEELAEQVWRAVLEREPSHELAGTGLAGLLLERGDLEGALAVLARLAPTEAVRQLQAAARLSNVGDISALEAAAAGGDVGAGLEYGKALAATGDYETAFEKLIDLVSQRDPEHSDAARLVVIDLFELLGPEHPLTAIYRRRLANALF